MRYRMRRLASVLTALTILVGLPVAGGAWLSSSKMKPSEPVQESTVVTFAAAAAGSTTITAAVPIDGTDTYPAAPEPHSGTSVVDWLCTVDDGHERCRPVKIGDAIPEAAATTSPTLPAAATEAPRAPGASEPVEAEPAAPLAEVSPPRAPSLERLVPFDPQSAEDWRPLIEIFFYPADVDRAVDIVECESHGQPYAKNPRSTASGLFQHLGSLWTDRAAKAGYGGADVFDPVANTAVAAWLVYEGGGWSHWNASYHCWG